MNTINRTFNTLETVNLATWYANIRNNEATRTKFDGFPINVQWALKKNITKINTIAQEFLSFKEEKVEQLQKEYLTSDETSNEIEQDGQIVRAVKPEYIEEFKEKANKLDEELRKLLEETHDIELGVINLNNVVEDLDGNISVTMDDLDMLSFMDEDDTSHNTTK